MALPVGCGGRFSIAGSFGSINTIFEKNWSK